MHFPYLLTLQLKRFDFDYTTMHRIKLNDRMTFPEELDMSTFIDVEDEVNTYKLYFRYSSLIDPGHQGALGAGGKGAGICPLM